MSIADLRRPLFALVMLVVAALAPRAAEACTCARGLAGACQQAWEADAVFVGTVTDISELASTEKAGAGPFASVRVRLAAVEPFFGSPGAAVDVLTGDGGGDCGYPFREGETYLVYAYRLPDGRLLASRCSRTAPVREAAEDLAYLRSLATMAPAADGRLFGEIRRVEQGLNELMPNLVVRIGGEGLEMETRSGPDGRFEVLVPPGEYQVSVQTSDDLYAASWPSPAKLADSRACVGVGVTIRFNGRVAGRVTTSSGAPVPFVSVQLSEPGSLYRPVHWRAAVRTDIDGRYMFERVTPGPYLVGVSSEFSGAFPFSPVFHPSAPTVAEADVVMVGQGSLTQLTDLVLLEGQRFVTLTGTVVDAEGRGWPGVEALFLAPTPTTTGVQLSPPVVTDESGRFRIGLRPDADYELVLIGTTAAGERMTERQALRVTENPEPVILTFQGGPPRPGQ